MKVLELDESAETSAYIRARIVPSGKVRTEVRGSIEDIARMTGRVLARVARSISPPGAERAVVLARLQDATMGYALAEVAMSEILQESEEDNHV